jgi:hypothetical protein
VSRIPKTTADSRPKEAGRGAERLATPNTQVIYHRYLLGPSFQQGRAVGNADGQLIGVEESVEEEAVQRHQQEEANDEFVKIPRKLKTGHTTLLAATQADWAREVICEIIDQLPLLPWYSTQDMGRIQAPL